jgi:SAM-dependent methyltransferase
MTDERPSWADPDIDLSTPTLARVYDFQLGGAHNFSVDREAARRLEEVIPGAARKAWSNRAFLRRAVQYCCGHGIDQFLDIGSGIPTSGNVHEVARELDPGARVVYVDIDPVAVIQSRNLLAGDDRTAVVQADLRDPEAILDDPATRRLIDFDRPVAVLLVSLMHVIADAEHPARLLARLTARCPVGSYLVISHLGWNYGTPEQVRNAVEWSRGTTTPITPRTPEQVGAMLGAFTPVEPGVVEMHDWRPDIDDGLSPRESFGYAVVARKD